MRVFCLFVLVKAYVSWCKWICYYQFQLTGIFQNISLLFLKERSILSTLNMLVYTYLRWWSWN